MIEPYISHIDFIYTYTYKMSNLLKIFMSFLDSQNCHNHFLKTVQLSCLCEAAIF